MTLDNMVSALQELKSWKGLPYCIEEPMGIEGLKSMIHLKSDFLNVIKKPVQKIKIAGMILVMLIYTWPVCFLSQKIR